MVISRCKTDYLGTCLSVWWRSDTELCKAFFDDFLVVYVGHKLFDKPQERAQGLTHEFFIELVTHKLATLMWANHASSSQYRQMARDTRLWRAQGGHQPAYAHGPDQEQADNPQSQGMPQRAKKLGK